MPRGSDNILTRGFLAAAGNREMEYGQLSLQPASVSLQLCSFRCSRRASETPRVRNNLGPRISGCSRLSPDCMLAAFAAAG